MIYYNSFNWLWVFDLVSVFVDGIAVCCGLHYDCLLFAVINAARLWDVDPEAALNASCAKFRRRFTYLEENTIRKGRQLSEMSLAQMDEIWDEAKAKGL